MTEVTRKNMLEAIRDAMAIKMAEDDNVVVLSSKSKITEKSNVVVNGAFGLDIALLAGSSTAVDAHAGHSH